MEKKFVITIDPKTELPVIEHEYESFDGVDKLYRVDTCENPVDLKGYISMFSGFAEESLAKVFLECGVPIVFSEGIRTSIIKRSLIQKDRA